MLRAFRLLPALIILVVCLLSCGRSPTTSTGVLEVRVTLLGDGGAADKRVEVLGTAMIGRTGEDGRIVFALPPGRYVIRVYELNQGGPGPRSIEQEAQVRSGRATRVEFFDCPECVSTETYAGDLRRPMA